MLCRQAAESWIALTGMGSFVEENSDFLTLSPSERSLSKIVNSFYSIGGCMEPEKCISGLSRQFSSMLPVLLLEGNVTAFISRTSFLIDIKN